MRRRENEKDGHNLKFKDDEILMAAVMIEKLESIIDLMYYLMEIEDIEPFSLILLTAEEIEIHDIIKNEKRDTDILVEIDKEKNIYLVLCQSTHVDGGYHFAERILNTILTNGGKNVYCSELEVCSSKNLPKIVIFKLIKNFMKAKIENKTNEIVYKSLN